MLLIIRWLPNNTEFLVFGKMSVYWLLSREEAANGKEASASYAASPQTSGVDSVPGLIGRMLRKYGWIFGVYVAVAGAGFALPGTLARIFVRQMISGVEGFFPTTPLLQEVPASF